MGVKERLTRLSPLTGESRFACNFDLQSACRVFRLALRKAEPTKRVRNGLFKMKQGKSVICLAHRELASKIHASLAARTGESLEG